MTNPRIRTRETSDDEMIPASRVVAPRRSIFTEDSGPFERLNPAEESDPSEDSDPEEEPFEDEEDSHSTRLRSPSPLFTTVPSSPAIPPSPTFPSLRFASCLPETPLRWDWMPTILRWWRRAEQLPVLPDVPGLDTPTPTLTQEPVHHTVPILIARLRTHDEQLEQLERAHEAPTREVEDLQHQVSGVESELAELRDEVVTTHTRGVEVQEEVAALRQQVAALQQEVAALRAERESRL